MVFKGCGKSSVNCCGNLQRFTALFLFGAADRGVERFI